MGKESFTLDELLNTEFGDSGEIEFNYRRGYTDGFISACMSVFDMLGAGISKKKAHERCVEFWTDELPEWARGDCSKVVLPPELKVNKHG